MKVNNAVASEGIEFYIVDGPCTSNGELHFRIDLNSNDDFHEVTIEGPLKVHHNPKASTFIAHHSFHRGSTWSLER